MEASKNEQSARIPVIALNHSAVRAFRLFNPNDWQERSRSLILSCSTEFSLLEHLTANIAEICGSLKERCQPHFTNIQGSWGSPATNLSQTIVYAQVPELHLSIKGFFSSIKSLLDLIVQLLSTEQVVNAELHGFHENGKRVLKALDRNVSAEKREIARKVMVLISDHKSEWIEAVVKSRDLLVHPREGLHQLMAEMQLAIEDGNLTLVDIIPPRIGEQSIDDYTATQYENVTRLIQSFFSCLRSVD